MKTEAAASMLGDRLLRGAQDTSLSDDLAPGHKGMNRAAAHGESSETAVSALGLEALRIDYTVCLDIEDSYIGKFSR